MHLQSLSHAVQESADVATAIAQSLLESGVTSEGAELDEDLVRRVRRMNINHVTVNIVTNGSVITSGTQPESSVICARSGGPLPRNKRQAIRWYVITACSSGYEGLLGIHRSQWWRLEAALPGGKLPGSGCSLKGFDDRTAAERLWNEKKPGVPAVYHSQVEPV